jgi:hypothetical protein
MKKILLITLVLAVVLSPVLSYASNNNTKKQNNTTDNNINAKTFKMIPEGIEVVNRSGATYVVFKRFYDPQTNVMCYSSYQIAGTYGSGFSCVYLGSKKK